MSPGQMNQKYRNAIQLIYSGALDELYPQPYNVLNNFGNNGLKENDHTKFLLSLLKYKRPKAREYTMPILLSFFEMLGIDTPLNRKEDVEITFSNVYADDNSKSFTDGLILQKGNFAVIIENKICGAADQKDQIKKYILAMKDKEQVPLDNIWVVYLTKDGTLHGGRPTADSYNEDAKDFEDYNIGEHLLCLSYRSDINSWLKTDVLPMVKYSECMLANSIDTYINHIETSILFTDELSIRRADLKKTDILKVLGVDSTDAVTMYSKLNDCISELDKNEIPNTNKSDVVMLRSTLVGYMDAIVRPVLEGLSLVTKSIFKEQKGVSAMVRTNRLSYGYIQILFEGKDPAVHYEWIPISTESLLSDKTFALLIHIEGKKKDSLKKSFDELYQKDFCEDFNTLCDEGILRPTQKHKCAIAVKLNDTIPNLIGNSKLKEALSPYYERALRYFEELNNSIS